jgi:hypothetical protein
MEERNIPVTIADIEALDIPINRKMKPEISIEEKCKTIIDAMGIAFPNVIFCVKNEAKAKAATTEARSEVSRLQDELRDLRCQINNPENPRVINPLI